MPGNKRASSAAGASSSAKKKKQQQVKMGQLFNNKAFLRQSLKDAHEGKRLLLTASALYTAAIPDGEKDLLFQYSITTINNDTKTATISFDNRCIKEGGDSFQNYPNTTDDDNVIVDYNIDTLKEDYELFNVHLGRVNKRLNDKKQEAIDKKAAEKMVSSEDMSDLDAKFNAGKHSGYELLLGEFEPVGDLLEHVIQSGCNTGKMNYKQVWSE